jgi:PAS domain-containing protein
LKYQSYFLDQSLTGILKSPETAQSITELLDTMGIQPATTALGGTQRRSCALNVSCGRVTFTVGDSAERTLWKNRSSDSGPAEKTGSINFGYGDPPRDENKLQEISKKYRLPLADLRKQAQAYPSRPQFLIDYAKTRLEKAAVYLGTIIEREQAARARRAGEEELRAANQQLAASNQQLRATEQQLRASNQQLEAANQQLAASFQQLLVTEQQVRDNETRLQSLVRILQHQSPSVQAFLDYALAEAIQLTKSKIGYIYFYNEKKREFTLNTWSKGVMDVCAITEPQTVYQLENTGIWGEAMRRRKEIMVNDFSAPHPLKKGYPKGHAPLNRFLTVPVFSSGQIVAVVGVANKKTDYDQSDVLQLKLLMDGVWKETDRKSRETALRHEKEWSQKIITNAPNIILGLQENSKITIFNRFAERLTGYTAEEVVGKE